MSSNDKTGIQGVESSPRFLNVGTALTETELLHYTLKDECRRDNLSDNLQSRPRRERQTPLINAHSRTLKVYRDYPTHSIFQMWVDFPEVDFLTTTPKYRMKKRNSPSWVHVLLKTSRSIREFYVFTSSYYYGRWCIFRVAARLAGFLFDDVLVAVTLGLLSSPIRCETKITKGTSFWVGSNQDS